jgi:hypothetical protein
MPDKNTIIWKDFQHAVDKRKSIINHLKDAALDSGTPVSLLKKMLLDLRQISLTIIEDALEIEYRTRMTASKQSKRSGGTPAKLPPITSFRALEDKEDIYALAGMIDDVDGLFSIPNIKVMLPLGFPNHRNPFMLGKTVDELSAVNPPHPEPGNVEEELRVMELLRYKRASRALLRAEAQMLNKLPLELYQMERLLDRMTDDFNIEKMLRAVCTILDNDTINHGEPNLTCLLSPVFNIEAHEILVRLNQFQGSQPLRVDVQVAIRQRLRDCTFEYLDDPASRFLLEWMEMILMTPVNQSNSRPATTGGLRALQSRGRTPSLASIAEGASENPDQLASEINSTDYNHTHEDITLYQAPRRKTTSPSTRMRMQNIKAAAAAAAAAMDGDSALKQPSLSTKESSVRVNISEMVGGSSSPSRGVSVGVGGSADASVGDDSSLESTSKSTVKGKKRKKIIDPKDKIPDALAEFSTSNAPPVLIKKKIRTEVEKVLKELGLSKAQDEEGKAVTVESLSSIRYELQKMQQELLRRQVLDPRHYNITSVDSVTQSQNGLTVAGVNSFDPMVKRRADRVEEGMVVATPLLVGEKNVQIAGYANQQFDLTLAAVLDYEKKCVWGNISTSIENVYKHRLIETNKPMPSNMSPDTPMQILQIKFTKLIYSLITEFSFDELVEAKPNHKLRMVQGVFEHLESIVHKQPMPRGQILPTVDRTLYCNKFAEDNVLVELKISRNESCDGIVIFCTPLAGLFQAHKLGIGPIIINLSDHELEVLLISQHGLFIQAVSKWSSMKMLAEWLASRIKVRKVPANTYEFTKTIPPQIEELKDSHEVDDQEKEVRDENASITSQVTFSPRKAEEDGEIASVAVSRPSYIPDKVNVNTLLLLEVQLSRQIQFSDLLLEHWKTRNLPKIAGLDCILDAYQDLEILNINIRLTIPSKRAYKRQVRENMLLEGPTNSNMMDMDEYSDDDAYDNVDPFPTVVNLNFQLTRPELLIFGFAPHVDSKAVTMTRSTEQDNFENHPESLMWNILNRLQVNFKVSTFKNGCNPLVYSHIYVILVHRVRRQIHTKLMPPLLIQLIGC